MDKLTECPCCGSDACSEAPLTPNLTQSLCWTCGFTTNNQMIDGSDNLSWYPKVINLQEMGMVFPEWNKRSKDWYWAAVKSIPVKDDEKERYPDTNNPGEFYKFRMDMKNIKRFNKLEFMDAAEEIGMFNDE